MFPIYKTAFKYKKQVLASVQIHDSIFNGEMGNI